MPILLHKKAWLSTFFADLSTLFAFFARRTVLNLLTIIKRGGKFRRHFCGKCGKVVHNICGQVYQSAYLVENVEKLSTIFVDSLLKRDEYVENVEKLSPLFVDNWLTSVMLWK